MRPVCVLALLVSACSPGAGAKPLDVRFRLGSRTVTVHAEVADTVDERARGLMGVRDLPQNRGMLFRWPDVGPKPFYMKDTLIPLDIIAINDDRVVSIVTLQPCPASTKECPISYTAPARDVLEVNANFAARAGIAVGAALAIT